MARRSNRKRNRRRSKIDLVSRLLYVLAAFSAMLIACVVFFRVEKVDVTGNERYDAQQISELSGVEQGDNLFTINKTNVKRRLLTYLPYLNEIEIIRSLPDTLSISVTECVPTAYLVFEDSYYILDRACKVLEQTQERPELAELTGVTALAPSPGFSLAVDETDRSRFSALEKLLAALEHRGMIEHISSIDLSSRAYILIGYDNQIDIRFGYAGDYAYTTNLAQSIITEQLSANDRGYLDVSDENGNAHFVPYS